MNCLEMVPTHPEQILNRTVDRKESLHLTCPHERVHLLS